MRMLHSAPRSASRAWNTLLEGGLPEGNTLLVQGAPGTGKTVLALQFLYEGATRLDAPGMMVTFEEQPRRLHRDARALGWDFDRLEQERRLLIVYTSPAVFLRELESSRYTQMAQEYGLRRIVVDSLTLFETLPQVLAEDATRIRFERIVNALRRDGTFRPADPRAWHPRHPQHRHPRGIRGRHDRSPGISSCRRPPRASGGDSETPWVRPLPIPASVRH